MIELQSIAAVSNISGFNGIQTHLAIYRTYSSINSIGLFDSFKIFRLNWLDLTIIHDWRR